MNARFPVGLLLKDCHEVQLYTSLEDLEDSLEEIDVANQEYGGWDADSWPIELRVLPAQAGVGPAGQRSPRWLDIRRSFGLSQPEQFLQAIEHHAKTMNILLGRKAGEEPIEYLRRVEVEDARLRRARMERGGIRSIFRRLLGRE